MPIGTRAGLGKGWRTWGNTYYRTWCMVVSPVYRVGIVVHLCRVLKAWSPSGQNYLIVLSFYTHGGSMNNGLYEHLVTMINALILMSSITCHILNEHHCFTHLYKYLIITLFIHQILYVGIKSCEYAMYSRCSHWVVLLVVGASSRIQLRRRQ
jgi:hypothetical protein